jgi:hypothetical protein
MGQINGRIELDLVKGTNRGECSGRTLALTLILDALLSGPSLADAQGASHPFLPIHRFDRSIFLCVTSHLNERKSSHSTGFPIDGEANTFHFSVAAKKFLDGLFCRFKRQIANINRHGSTPNCMDARKLISDNRLGC